jgi:hypothetical protein
MAVKNGLAASSAVRDATGPAHPTVLKSKTSAAGRTATFTYDANGNLKTAKNGRNFGPTYIYNPNGTLATAADAPVADEVRELRLQRLPAVDH